MEAVFKKRHSVSSTKFQAQERAWDPAAFRIRKNAQAKPWIRRDHGKTKAHGKKCRDKDLEEKQLSRGPCDESFRTNSDLKRHSDVDVYKNMVSGAQHILTPKRWHRPVFTSHSPRREMALLQALRPGFRLRGSTKTTSACPEAYQSCSGYPAHADHRYHSAYSDYSDYTDYPSYFTYMDYSDGSDFSVLSDQSAFSDHFEFLAQARRYLINPTCCFIDDITNRLFSTFFHFVTFIERLAITKFQFANMSDL